MKKIIIMIIVGVLVVPLVIAGSGLTNIFSYADVTGGWLEFSQTDFWGDNLAPGSQDPNVKAASNLSVVNLGNSMVTATVEANRDPGTYQTGPCPSGDCDIPPVQKWTFVNVEPLVCETPPPGGGCGDPYKSESIAWSDEGEAYLNTNTYTEQGTEQTLFSVYGKGGEADSWNSAGIVINSLDEGFVEWGYSALGDFCNNVDQCPTPQPPPPTPPTRPDCEGGFCP